MSESPFMKTPFPEFREPERMSAREARKEIEQLRRAIEHHNYLYYVRNSPVISDSKYDQLFKRLLKLEEQFPEFQSGVSPSRKVGAPAVDRLEKKKHRGPMLSLNSSDDEKEVRDFVGFIQRKAQEKKTEFMLEPKFDGLTVEIMYENGQFSYAATRGDGETGEDVSENVKTIGSVPLKLRITDKVPASLSVRGEILMSREGFRKLNKERIEKGQEAFANPRNAAAGLVRQLDSKKVAGKPLDIFFYELIAAGEEDFYTHSGMLQKFPEWGLKTDKNNHKCSSLSEIRDYYHDLDKRREELPYEIDGIVIKLDNRKLRKEIGARQRSPRWAFAWKFKPKKEITTLREIIIQVGRTGILTPVALLDPVEVGGATVSRATLHNEDEVNEKDVRPGDRVRVMRAGDVIPEIAERVKTRNKRGEKFKMPDQCPVCGTRVVREGAYVVCPAGLACKAQLKGRLSHFASRGAMNIENLGEKVVEQLVDRGMVENVPDLYELSAEDIAQLDGFAECSARKLYEAIQGSKSPDLDHFLYALGIRHAGIHVARLIAGKYKTLEKIQKAGYDELLKIREIGPEIAESIVHFFSNKNNRDILGQLMKNGIRIQSPGRKASGSLEGKTLVLTGELDGYTRDEAKEKIESLGGRATSSVSSETDFLVAGKNPGKKLEEAKKRNVEIIDEKRFRKLIGNKKS